MMLLLCWRKEKEIKASSPILSMLMMIGSYLLCVAPVLLILRRMIEIRSVALLSAMCNIETWFKSIGLDLILSTLFLRLLRVYRIFKMLATLKKYWFDEYLLLYVLLICAGKVFLHILWSAIDTIHPETQQVYIPSGSPPYYNGSVRCSSKAFDLWVLISLLYSGILLLLVLSLAIQTRHIKEDGFKDTKKVNLFIFLAVIVLATAIPLWLIFGRIGAQIVADIFEWLAYFAVAMLCQLCLFSPKMVPLALTKSKMYTGSNGTKVTSKSQHITVTLA